MRSLTEDTIRKYKKSYIENESNAELTQKYRTGSISDIAFDMEKAAQQKFAFSIDIPTMKAVSQGYAGRCWIVAGLNLLREIAVQKMDRNSLPDGEFRFSTAYLCFWDKVEKANCFLEKAIQDRNKPYDKREVHSWFQYAVTDGGFWTYFTDLVRKYGLVPAEIMAETAQSVNTEVMNNRLNYYIRKISADIRNAGLQSKTIDDIYLIKNQAMERIFTFLCHCYGYPPDEFEYTYKRKNGNIQTKIYTPLAFSQELLEDFTENCINVISLPYEKLPFGEICVLRDVFHIVGMHEETFLNLPLVELKKYCVQQLKDGIPVACVADDDKMCRDELQLWDDKSFDYEKVTGFSFEMSRKDYFQLKAGIACHSMLITGVHLDENDKPQRWKILNSYDIDGLHQGYFTCSDSWFDKYMVTAVICRKYLNGYEQQLQQKPNLFDIWEIM
ncbi:MAG: hypothetical protein K2J99_03020 [Lachnospiraceae bacterium]|nr:hypothetical protein [Lachnospiraceae bacterium]